MILDDIASLPVDRFFVIAGPCVIESLEVCLTVGRRMKAVCDRLELPYIFKASFDKANRSSAGSYRGLGIEQGLKVLEQVKRELNVPVLSDVHESDQPALVAGVVDVMQVPAFLARQTDLLIACGKTGRWVNVKKGQFMAPAEMGTAIEKVRATGNDKVMVTERGTFFGYNRLVNDFTGLEVMKKLGRPVIFDVTHSTQEPAGLGGSSGGNPQYAPLLARAAIAAGVNGLFLEAHPDPRNAKSDAATMLDLDSAQRLLESCGQIARLRSGWV